MDSKSKKLIYDIITDSKLSALEKYNKIKELFPNYLEIIDEKKAIYEKIEWIFHDGLWTYFELLLFDKINEFYSLWLEETNKQATIWKMEHWIELYHIFFEKNEYKVDFKKEIYNIEKWALFSLEKIKEKIWDEKIKNLTHSSQDYSNWNARDIFITLESGEDLNFSLKTDKSWKVAISDWQTPKVFEKVYNRYFNLSSEDYESLKLELFKTNDEKIIFDDFQNVALLTQVILIRQFKLEKAEVNNFKDARITDLNTLEYLIENLKLHKNWKDKASVLLVNRLSWEVWFESILDDIFDIELEDFSFNPHKPKNGYSYWSTLWFKYKWKTFITFQIKHKRWKNPSHKFGDITIRIEEK